MLTMRYPHFISILLFILTLSISISSSAFRSQKCLEYLCNSYHINARECLCPSTKLHGSRTKLQQSNGRKHKLATILTTRQCTFTDFQYVRTEIINDNENLPSYCSSALNRSYKSTGGLQKFLSRGVETIEQSTGPFTDPQEKTIPLAKDIYDQYFLNIVKEKRFQRNQGKSNGLGHGLMVAANRNKHSKKHKNFETSATTTSPAVTVTDVKKAAPGSHGRGNSKRFVRSTHIGSLAPVSKLSLTWKLDSANRIPSKKTQKNALTLAFGEWERHSNVCFLEKTDAGSADISIRFDEEIHSLHQFNLAAAHAKSGEYIHVNSDWTWYKDQSSISTNEENAAVMETVFRHEVGHLLGVTDDPVVPDNTFAMSEDLDLSRNPRPLSAASKVQIKEEYGKCTGDMDAVIDLQWTESYTANNGQLMTALYFKTLVVRKDLIWQYSHVQSEALPGYPILVDLEIPGVSEPSAILQLKTTSEVMGTYVFTGDSYKMFQVESMGMLKLNKSGSITDFGLPAGKSIDAGFFDIYRRDIYLISGTLVYRVEWDPWTDTLAHNSLNVFDISNVFTAKDRQTDSSYYNGIDSIYHHINTDNLYIFRGNKLWRSENLKNSFSMTYLGKQNDTENTHLFDYICNPFSCK